MSLTGDITMSSTPSMADLLQAIQSSEAAIEEHSQDEVAKSVAKRSRSLEFRRKGNEK